jgi:hypothetical protein
LSQALVFGGGNVGAAGRNLTATQAKGTSSWALRKLTHCPYRFIYEYEIKGGKRHSTCQDWETEATFFHWRKQYGEAEALKRMHMRWSEELPAKGLLFGMGTHSLYPSTWLLNELIQVSKTDQPGSNWALEFGYSAADSRPRCQQ